MSKSVFINLPVKDVAAARSFYEKAGFSINSEMSNDQNFVVVIDDNIMLMMVAHDFFKQNVKRDIADTATYAEVGIAIQVADEAEVNKIVEAAIAAGAVSQGEVSEEFMISRGFTDLDGHRLDILCMKG
jgi:predicted lactoylglutathione lyase